LRFSFCVLRFRGHARDNLALMTDAADLKTIADRLDAARQDLLELSTRNRLLSTPRHAKRARALEVVDEKSDELYRLLVEGGASLTFQEATEETLAEQEAEAQAARADAALAPDGPTAPDEPDAPAVEPGSAGDVFRGPDAEPAGTPLLEQPEADAAEAALIADPDRLEKRHRDLKLQTRLGSAALQKRLLRTYYDARSSELEQGVNTLYLALGFLKWYEDDTTQKARYAPLVLVPVTLSRKNARTQFSIAWNEDEVSTNLSLQAKLKADFGLELPDLVTEAVTGDAAGAADDAADSDGAVGEARAFRPSDYFAGVRDLLRDVKRWEVCADDAVLSFFSFSKFLMYRDLDPGPPDRASALDGHPLLGALMGEGGFTPAEPVLGDGQSLDEVVSPRNTVHVTLADTSQASAVEAVRRGQNLVIQGPPGTGKSQTITNLIAAAVKEGKTVLFVAEKMAALEVVQRRLSHAGLGDMCLELHSHKARKKRVLDDLQRTMGLGAVTGTPDEAWFQKLAAAREAMTGHAVALHTPVDATGVTPFAAVGELVRLRGAGMKPGDFTLDDPLTWTADAAQEARGVLAETLARLGEVGPPADHPWRGAAAPGVTPMDLERLAARLPDATAALRTAAQQTAALADALNADGRATAGWTADLAGRARRMAEQPALDADAIVNDVWGQQGTPLSALVEQGQHLSQARKQLDGVVVDAAWTADAAQARIDLAAHGRAWLRWLNGAYRRAQATLRGLCVAAPPKPLSERLALLDRLIEAQRAVKTIERDDALGRYAFGDRWRGVDSDWDAISKIHGWNRRNETGDDPAAEAGACRTLAATLSDAERAKLPALAESAERASASAGRLLEAAATPVALGLDEAFGVAALIDVPFHAAADRLAAWGQSPDGLTKFLGYHAQRARARDAGLGELVERLEDRRIAADDALSAFDLARFEAVLRKAFADRPELASFDGAAHEQRLSTFRTLDGDRMTLARREVAAAHHDGMPSAAAIGELGVLKREFQKKRNHLPLRRLLREAGQAIQAIKPVFMMSPMSVAQFLERDDAEGGAGLSFDLMLMDEASQVRPVDALGAVARSRQLVVVGDDKQLPPTRFFATSVSADETGEQDAADLNTADLESILGLCTAQSMPGTMLRWHYRSKHPSLIAVSNREFYDDRLQVIPSPVRKPEDLGVRFHRITDGFFDRGGSATHRVEAQAIAAAVIEHARESPHRSLGVGAFSVGQRDLILDELEALRREHADVDGFFTEDVEEPFFVKNLENIQGDERDVIFISVGYGPDKDGNVSMNFGPLSADGGERRLNVLITRAKRRLEVFSSLVAGDIDLNRVSRRGPAAFKTFLAFAERGGFADEGGRASGGEPSVFERAVIDALASRGLAAEAQVGAGGMVVDVAVIDPTDESRYALAVLTDGPGYAAARSARERDASREGVLKMMGWNTLRVWGLDWFNRPGEQADRIVAAVEAATRGDQAEEVGAPSEAGAVAAAAAEGIQRAEAEGPAEFQPVPYREASFKKTPRKDLDGLDANALMDLVVRVVEIEEPVHGDEVTRRAADIYRVERLTAKLRKLLEAALSDAVHAGRLDGSSGFYSLPGAVSTRLAGPRSRAEVASAGLRRPDRLPPAELRVVLEQVVGSAIGVSVDDAVSEAARRLGYRSVRKPLRAVIERELKALLDFGVLVNEGGALGIAGAQK